MGIRESMVNVEDFVVVWLKIDTNRYMEKSQVWSGSSNGEGAPEWQLKFFDWLIMKNGCTG